MGVTIHRPACHWRVFYFHLTPLTDALLPCLGLIFHAAARLLAFSPLKITSIVVQSGKQTKDNEIGGGGVESPFCDSGNILN